MIYEDLANELSAVELACHKTKREISQTEAALAHMNTYYAALRGRKVLLQKAIDSLNALKEFDSKEKAKKND